MTGTATIAITIIHKNPIGTRTSQSK